MPFSEEQWEHIGDCKECESPIYQLTQGAFKGQLWSKKPAPGCNCWIEEGEEEEDENI